METNKNEDMDKMDKVEVMWDVLKSALGSEGLVEELHRALNVDVLEEHLEYIARMNDIEIEY